MQEPKSKFNYLLLTIFSSVRSPHYQVCPHLARVIEVLHVLDCFSLAFNKHRACISSRMMYCNVGDRCRTCVALNHCYFNSMRSLHCMYLHYLIPGQFLCCTCSLDSSCRGCRGRVSCRVVVC